MTPLRRLHDKLVQAEGIECACDTKGPAACPAWHAATKRQHHRDNPQLQLTPEPHTASTYDQLPDDY